MRLLQGKLNIVWNHDGNAPNYRLQITVVGQGAVCLERDKHSCLEYVGMPLLCIARELVCDGLPNCPPIGSEVSDENEAMCVKHRQQEYSVSFGSLLALLPLGRFRFFAYCSIFHNEPFSTE